MFEAVYGLAENVGAHVILSNLFWWASFGITATAYKHRKMWNVGGAPWAMLFLAFFSFGIRELGHLTKDPLLSGVRYVFGMWSAIFLLSVFLYLFLKICQRREPSKLQTHLPLAAMLVVPVVFGYLLYTGGASSAKAAMSTIEGYVWVIAGSLTVYLTYMLGRGASGSFVTVYLLFQFAAYFAIIWKLLGLLKVESYGIREVFETMFGLFAAGAVYTLGRMLKKLSGKLSSEQ